MNIPVTYIEENLTLRFMHYGLGEKRLWIRDDSVWYNTVGSFCPHINISGGECVDCSLNIE